MKIMSSIGDSLLLGFPTRDVEIAPLSQAKKLPVPMTRQIDSISNLSSRLPEIGLALYTRESYSLLRVEEYGLRKLGSKQAFLCKDYNNFLWGNC